eukprot:3421391-Pyramimonas_sp.AAC.1
MLCLSVHMRSGKSGRHQRDAKRRRGLEPLAWKHDAHDYPYHEILQPVTVFWGGARTRRTLFS